MKRDALVLAIGAVPGIYGSPRGPRTYAGRQRNAATFVEF
jgi:hypothetical protein